MMGTSWQTASWASIGVASRTDTRDLPLEVLYSRTEGTTLYSLCGPKVVGVVTFRGMLSISPLPPSELTLVSTCVVAPDSSNAVEVIERRLSLSWVFASWEVMEIGRSLTPMLSSGMCGMAVVLAFIMFLNFEDDIL